MAGIGFVLQKLTSRDDLLGFGRAYVHAAFATAGPWLFTVLALGGITLFLSDYYASDSLLSFRITVIYNFAFSLVATAPVFMVVTRYLADSIHAHDVREAPGVLLYCLALSYALVLPLAIFFYGYYFELSPFMRVSATLNLFLISGIWLLSVFLTALKDYQAVTRAFGIGMLIALVAAQAAKRDFGDVGMVNGFSLGLMWIVFALVAKIFAEYPYRLAKPASFFGYMKKYKELAIGGLCYNAAIWVDKWIMWFAPEAVELPSHMRMYPDYDSAMFLAYLTIVPALAMFVFSVETKFFLDYKKFYYDILEHKPLKTVRANQQRIIETIFAQARNFLVVQGALCFLAIALAAPLFGALNINYLQIGIFRLGALGAFFNALMLFELIILSYFDCRKAWMWVNVLFLAANTLFTFGSLPFGFAFYGYGYFLASSLAFAVTSVLLFKHIRELPYHAFITHNNALRR